MPLSLVEELQALLPEENDPVAELQKCIDGIEAVDVSAFAGITGQRDFANTKEATISTFGNDKDGYYDVEKANAYAAKHGVRKDMDVSELVKMAAGHSTDEELNSPEFWKRAAKADLKQPLTIHDHPEGAYIADGLHRVMQAKKLGLKTLPVHVVKSFPKEILATEDAPPEAPQRTREEVLAIKKKVDLIVLPEDVPGTSCGNCLLPGNIVAGAFISASKAFYSGEAVEITTASGNRITTTVNHPVFSENGVISAGFVYKGLHLLCYSGNIQRPSFISPEDEQYSPALAEEVFQTFIENRPAFTVKTPSSLDFHGDGQFLNGNVDVVRSNRPLDFTLDIQSLKGSGKVSLSISDGKEFIISGDGTANLCIDRVFLPSTRLLRLLCDSGSDSGIGGIEFLHAFSAGYGKQFAMGVPPVCPDLLCSVASTSESREAMFSETSFQGRVATAGFLRKVRQVFSSDVTLDEVVNVRLFHYDGPVYDFGTSTNFLIAGNVYISNCVHIDEDKDFCNHSEILLPVTPRECCVKWDHPGTGRDFGKSLFESTLEMAKAMQEARKTANPQQKLTEIVEILEAESEKPQKTQEKAPEKLLEAAISSIFAPLSVEELLEAGLQAQIDLPEGAYRIGKKETGAYSVRNTPGSPSASHAQHRGHKVGEIWNVNGDKWAKKVGEHHIVYFNLRALARNRDPEVEKEAGLTGDDIDAMLSGQIRAKGNVPMEPEATMLPPGTTPQQAMSGEVAPVTRQGEVREPAYVSQAGAPTLSGEKVDTGLKNITTRSKLKLMRDPKTPEGQAFAQARARLANGSNLDPTDKQVLREYNQMVSKEAGERVELELNKLPPEQQQLVQNITNNTTNIINEDPEVQHTQAFFPDVSSFITNTLGIAYSKAEQWNNEFQKQRGLPPEEAKRLAHGLAIADYAIGTAITSKNVIQGMAKGNVTGLAGIPGVTAASFVPWATVGYMAAAPFMTAVTQPGSFTDKLKAGLMSPLWAAKAAFNVTTDALDKLGVGAVTAPAEVIPQAERAQAVQAHNELVQKAQRKEPLSDEETARLAKPAIPERPAHLPALKGAGGKTAKAKKTGTGKRGRPPSEHLAKLSAKGKLEHRRIGKAISQHNKDIEKMKMVLKDEPMSKKREELEDKIKKKEQYVAHLEKKRATLESIAGDAAAMGLWELLEDVVEQPQSESNLDPEDIDIVMDALADHQDNPDWYMVLLLSAYGQLGDMLDAADVADAAYDDMPDGPPQEEAAAAQEKEEANEITQGEMGESLGAMLAEALGKQAPSKAPTPVPVVAPAGAVPPTPTLENVNIKELLLEQERKFLAAQRQIQEALASRPVVVQMVPCKMKRTLVRNENGEIVDIIEEPVQ